MGGILGTWPRSTFSFVINQGCVGVEFLQVKTLSGKHPDEGYKKTRAFYLADGFRPLEEFPNLWGLENPALQLIKVVAGQ